MKKGTIILSSLAGLAGLTGYTVYKYRHHIKADYAFMQEEIKTAQRSSDAIQKNLAVIKEQTELLKSYSQDSQQKLRLFQQEIKPKLAEITARLDHIQQMTANKN